MSWIRLAIGQKPTILQSSLYVFIVERNAFQKGVLDAFLNEMHAVGEEVQFLRIELLCRTN